MLNQVREPALPVGIVIAADSVENNQRDRVGTLNRPEYDR
jgi:hypothetical protein